MIIPAGVEMIEETIKAIKMTPILHSGNMKI
jgi:hypothetical protein